MTIHEFGQVHDEIDRHQGFPLDFHGESRRPGGACCDYCIVGDQNPLAAEYELKAAGNGLLVSVRKER